MPTENNLMIASVHHINNKTRQATYKNDISHLLQNKNVMQFAYNEHQLLLLGDKKKNTIEGYHYAGQFFLFIFLFYFMLTCCSIN